MTRILEDNPAYKLALEAADHQCQNEATRGRGADKHAERCVHTDRAGYRLCLVMDDQRGPLVMCEPCLTKIQAATARKAAKAVLPGQESLF